MHVINHPDLPGDACDVCQHCVELPTWNASSLPNFPNYRLGAAEEICDTTTSTTFNLNTSPEITVFPNPATSYINIQFEEPLSKSSVFTLSNTLGEIILKKEIPPFTRIQEFDVQYFPNGVYFYTIQMEGQVLKTGKVVIIVDN